MQPLFPQPERHRISLVLRGTVQGIGLRPWLVILSTRLGLGGSVTNQGADVHVVWEGTPASVEAAREALRSNGPPGLRITDWVQTECPPTGTTRFVVEESAAGTPGWSLPPDLAPCPDCLSELLTPTDRRYRYPFLSCTRCGPRWSTATTAPWARANTTFAPFPLCPRCVVEFDNPTNRRFHAETIACPDCGPSLAWIPIGSTEPVCHREHALATAEDSLRSGNIVGVLGVGGFHLLVDASNTAALERLRDRKQRQTKPFAVLFPDTQWIRRCARVGHREQCALESPARPIVLLQAMQTSLISTLVAPDLATLGAVLPMSPLHHLLATDLDIPLVCTSGNVSGEPLAWDTVDALQRLGAIADGFLVHDRAIAAPVDDPVIRVIDNQKVVIRHGRGTAPLAIRLIDPVEPSRAWGSHLKTAPAVAYGTQAVLGPHGGDLDTIQGRKTVRRLGNRLAGTLHQPTRHELHDRHPDSPTSDLARESGLPCTAIPHHQAHASALATEHGEVGPMLVVAWDGTGWGDDERAWGGEFLVREGPGPWRRMAHLPGFPLIGGDAAARDPRRCAFALLAEVLGTDRAMEWACLPESGISTTEAKGWLGLLTSGIACPHATSAGRWFDAMACLLGISQLNSWEGEAASRLESAASRALAEEPLPDFCLRKQSIGPVVDGKDFLETVLGRCAAGASPAALALGFHRALARLIASVAAESNQPSVGLTGGCFVNKLLTEATAEHLRSDGFRVLLHSNIPPGDGGLALGQLAWFSENGDPNGTGTEMQTGGATRGRPLATGESHVPGIAGIA